MKYNGFVGPSYTAYSSNLDAQQCMNWFPELDESGMGKNVGMLIQRPGLTSPFTTLATTPVRALWTGGDPNSTERLFAAGGSKLIEITGGGGLTVRGDIGDDASHTPVTLMPNGNQLGVVSAGKFYCDNGVGPVQPNFGNNIGTCSLYNVAGVVLVYRSTGAPFDASTVGGTLTVGGVGYTISAVYSGNWLLLATGPATGTYTYSFTVAVTAGSGTFLDGYYIIARPNSKTFNISGFNDGTSWDALDFAQKEGYPDNIATVIADHELLWILGTESTEPWQNTGAANFPFQRIDAGVINVGCRAKYSVCRISTLGFAFIGGTQDGQPIGYLMSGGFTPRRISTNAVEKAWDSYSTVLDAIGYVHEWRGHIFWTINFPTADKTWVYDVGMNVWHERGWWNGSANGRERGRCHAYCYGKHLVGDYSSGAVYQMSDTQYTDNGTAIHRSRTGPYAPNPSEGNDLYQFFQQFVLDMETGVGSSPVMSLDWTNDGGHTFNTPITTTAGAAGNYSARVVWRRLGKVKLPYQRAFRISTTDASKMALIDASYE